MIERVLMKLFVELGFMPVIVRHCFYIKIRALLFVQIYLSLFYRAVNACVWGRGTYVQKCSC